MTVAASSYCDHVIVCGLGKVGYRVVQTFLDIGQDVVAIENDSHHNFNELVRGQGVTLLIGDARQSELLQRAGLQGCLALVIVTNDDLTNLDVALTARELRPDIHIVMRVFNDTLAQKLEGSFGIRTAFSASAIAAPTFAAAALMRGVGHALHVGNYLLSTIELQLTPTSKLVGQQLGDFEQSNNVVVLELRTSTGSDLRPSPEHRLDSGNTIVVVGELHTLAELRELNYPRQGGTVRGIREDAMAQLLGQQHVSKRRVERNRRMLTAMPRRIWRLFRANLRDADLLLHESIEPLSAFLVFLLLGTLLLHGISNPNSGEAVLPGYRDPDTGAGLDWVQALYAMLMMSVFETPLALPDAWWLRLLFFLWPIMSLILLARGALSFVMLLLDKRNRREAWDTALATTYYDHIIVSGISKSGYRIVQEFIDLHYDVVVIDRDLQGEFNQLLRAQDVPVLIGDSRQEDMLRSAGVERCAALIIVSDDDLTNLDTALTARNLRPDLHIVLGVFNEALARKLEISFGIRTAFSTPLLAAPTFAAAALMRGVRHALLVGERLLSTIELTVRKGSLLDGRFLRRIEQDQNVSVIELRRSESSTSDLRPRPDHRLAAGDTLVIVGELHTLGELRDQNQELNNDPMGRNRAAVLTRLRRDATRYGPES